MEVAAGCFSCAATTDHTPAHSQPACGSCSLLAGTPHLAHHHAAAYVALALAALGAALAAAAWALHAHRRLWRLQQQQQQALQQQQQQQPAPKPAAAAPPAPAPAVPEPAAAPKQPAASTAPPTPDNLSVAQVRLSDNAVPASPFSAAANLPPFSARSSALPSYCASASASAAPGALAALPPPATSPWALPAVAEGPENQQQPPPSCGPSTPAHLSLADAAALQGCRTASTASSSRPWDLGTLPPAIAAATPMALQRQSTLPGEDAPPELKRVMAEGEEAAARLASAGRRGSGQVAADSLPPRLQELLVDASQVEFLRDAKGRLVELGRGASGRVVKARLYDQEVAAKIIDLGKGSEAREAFLTEASRLCTLRHAHVVTLLGLALRGSKAVILMELCEGRDLFTALTLTAADGERVFGWTRRGRQVVRQLAKALTHIHARGYAHLDVKSANVFLTECGTAKLGDCGMSRRCAGVPHNQSYVFPATPLPGTFSYMAPEVMLGCPADQPSDIYSLGVIAWELITGERPQRGQLRMPRVPAECSSADCDLMLRCMAQDPAARPTAAQVLQELSAQKR